MYDTAVKYCWFLRRKHIVFHRLHLLLGPFSSLSSINAVCMPKKRKKKSGASSKPKTSKQNFPCHLAFPTTKLAFLENMTSDTERRNALLVSKCLLRCLTTALWGCDGSILEVCEEKISCRSGTASIMALQCWKRKVLRWGRYPPVKKQGKPRPAAHLCVCMHVQHKLASN